MKIEVTNPITGMDYPDPDVIRVRDIYYMVSTTMYFMPGCEILRSYDLVNWEHAAYVYERLDSTPGQMLTGEANIYGKGMWAASLRFHKGIFYVCFVANDTRKTYLFTSKAVEGPWEKHYIEGFYHDNSILFDDDGSVYIAYGNKDIFITQLKPDLSGPLEGGLHRLAVSDVGHPGLGYEGAHFYKINGKYYLFLIHSLRDKWMRVEACFMSDSIGGEFTGGDVLVDDRGYCGQGVAQGGIVDTPEGKWYGILFQDMGAVGRIPVLMPVSWEGDWPVFGRDGKIPDKFHVFSEKPEYRYEPLAQSDAFRGEQGLAIQEQIRRDRCFGLKSAWQFNHEPDLALIELDRKKGQFRIKTDKLCRNLTQAKNTLTQRTHYPRCAGEVTVDFSGLREGDYAGICTLQGSYGLAAVTKRHGRNLIVMQSMETESSLQRARRAEEKEWEQVAISEDAVRLRVEADFTGMKDEATFFYWCGEAWKKIGVTHKLYFRMDHFTGCRFGLCVYSTLAAGGSAAFSDFIYEV